MFVFGTFVEMKQEFKEFHEREGLSDGYSNIRKKQNHSGRSGEIRSLLKAECTEQNEEKERRILLLISAVKFQLIYIISDIRVK